MDEEWVLVDDPLAARVPLPPQDPALDDEAAAVGGATAADEQTSAVPGGELEAVAFSAPPQTPLVQPVAAAAASHPPARARAVRSTAEQQQRAALAAFAVCALVVRARARACALSPRDCHSHARRAGGWLGRV